MMDMYLPEMSYVLWDNSLQSWLHAVTTILTFYFLTRLLRSMLVRRVGKTAPVNDTGWDDLLIEMLDRVHPIFLIVVSVYMGTMPVALPELITQIIHKIFVIASLLQIGRLASHVLRSLMDRYRRSRIEKNAEAVTTLSSVTFILRVLLWVSLLLVALDNFGVNITTLIAGMGVGGIAVALAVQSILGDLFASFSIVLDKPFVIGDFIVVGEFMGTVEYIGLKTTRLRSLSGEQLIFSNADLLSSRVRNYKRMFERRVVFSIGVPYQTSPEKIESIPSMIKGIVRSMKTVRFDRAHFMEYGPYSLNFETVYWVLTPDYDTYMDIQQDIYLKILRMFQQNSIDFACPTQTAFFNSENGNDQLPESARMSLSYS
jgi:small-conductance mechanosensitive channel